MPPRLSCVHFQELDLPLGSLEIFQFFLKNPLSWTIRVTLPPYPPNPSATLLTPTPGILGIRKNALRNAGFID